MSATQSRVDIYFDFTCPYVYRAGLWLQAVQAHTNGDLHVEWRYFPLSQINNKQEGWKVWEQPIKNPNWEGLRWSRGLRAMWAHAAARQQGEEAGDAYLIALLKAIHEDRLSLDNDEATRAAAERVGLDVEQWEADARATELLDAMRRDFEQGAEELNIFGTPTFAFPNVRPAYLKLDKSIPETEALEYWENFYQLVVEKPLVTEIKRPH